LTGLIFPHKVLEILQSSIDDTAEQAKHFSGLIGHNADNEGALIELQK